MTDLKISIIIPVYNAAKFLSRCLDSVLTQDYKNLEIICIDDGSTDESLSILHIYKQKDSRIKVISQFNQGAAAARNKGLKNATGDYISFIDADDTIFPGLYSYFVQAIKNDEVDIFMFNGRVGDKDSAFFNHERFYHPVEECQNVTYKDFYGIFYGNSGVYNKIFKKSCLDKNTIFFLVNNSFEDIDFWFRSLIIAKNVKVSFKNFYHYHLDNENSVTRTFGLNALSIFDTFNSMMNAAKKQNLYDYFNEAFLQYQYEKITETLFLMKPEYQEKLYNKAQKFLKERCSQMVGKRYQNLLDFNICYNILTNDFIDFKNTLLLFKDSFHYVTQKPQKLKFSIIVPIYNVEPYLKTCLKSLINQTYKDFEIICINDGSTDKSLDILNFHASKDVRIKIINQENKGLGAARNVGVKHAQGEYLIFVDSDDWLRTDALEILEKQIKNNPVEACLIGHNDFFDEKKVNVHVSLMEQLQQKAKSEKNNALEFLCDAVTAWSKIYRRDFWQKYDFKFAEGVYFEDTVTNAQIFYHLNKIDICPDNLYYYRLTQNSITRKMFSDKKINDLFDAFYKTFLFLSEKQIYSKVQANFVDYTKRVFNFYSNQISEQQKENYWKRFFELISAIN